MNKRHQHSLGLELLVWFPLSLCQEKGHLALCCLGLAMEVTGLWHEILGSLWLPRSELCLRLVVWLLQVVLRVSVLLLAEGL